MSILDVSIRDLHTKIRDKEIKPSELTEVALQRIEETDGTIKAYLTVTAEEAMARAKKLDNLPEGNLPLLYGIPGALKDNMCTEGVRTTCASQILANYIPPYTATAVAKLEEHNYVLVGKTNMDEFAMGSSTENSSFFKTANPWDPERVPGGSSGGSAATVAAGHVPFALGSDTGGSVRQPASYCGVVGLKPTYGRVSRFGLVAFASSLDQIGPIARNVEDAATVLQAVAGYDKMDSTSANVEVPDYLAALTGDIKGLRIGMPKEYFAEGLDPEVAARVREAIQTLESLGAVVEEVTLPHTQYAVSTYYLIAPAEASSNLARYDGVRYGVRVEDAEALLDMYKKTRAQGFGPEVKRRIMLGTYALSSGYYDAYYLRAQKVRTLIKQDFDKVFERFDVVVSPTAPTVAFKSGEKIDDPMTMYLNDIYTIPVNLAGLPGISVPCGLAQGMPVGLQIIGKAFDESTLLKVAHAYEQQAKLDLRPALAGGVRA
ncbi:Asp-tRNA(Asn)/Glu-tRNA(Gln) amidotransferase subunit GatA [Effusibacillus lacus]|uniref:Glutamyl-tRNA(Gln) amidotransferase subunit A n=1 Tax=Effusibacillus lacus TaxID=1348429 RepID=A0A292YPQ0_9BACL|nr:Asp-tRNA(Asn)/Glu-tRNA(Gln) amidotransferase subunit GatA [Effusibacillus lacus]TCS76825.1 aspartyl/glutamyl-tRNA(Asn/Gln) amidotransferase subunit A [Effusibacillus lacus]GAX91156.1 aspartyl/glutamyl-tRNA amidotransferase subunit A [Effusibacillus lacus]